MILKPTKNCLVLTTIVENLVSYTVSIRLQMRIYYKIQRYSFKFNPR